MSLLIVPMGQFQIALLLILFGGLGLEIGDFNYRLQAIGIFIVIVSAGFIAACLQEDTMLLYSIPGAVFLIAGLKFILDSLTPLAET